MGIMSRRRMAEQKKAVAEGKRPAPEEKSLPPEKPKPTHAAQKRRVEKYPESLLERDKELTRRGE